jgi:hypothetical protein
MTEQEKGFVIRDRRGQGGESDERPASSAAEAAKRPEPRSQEDVKHEPADRLPPTFLTFVYSLGTSALMLLGESPEQGVSGPPQNLGHAQEIIDILTILEAKTKGNLTQDEDTLLQEMLYTLRIKYVEKASSSKS